MKKVLLTLALAALATFANAQGTIQFANNAGTRFNVDGVRPVNTSSGGPAAGTYAFAAFVGTSEGSLQLAGDIGANTATGGLISSPNPQAHQLPGFAPDSTVFIQIRGWDTRNGIGNDWAAAKQRGTYGETAVRSVLLGPSSGPGTVIWSSTDLTKFQTMNLVTVPEPSTIALGVLGLGSLLLFRRRKN